MSEDKKATEKTAPASAPAPEGTTPTELSVNDLAVLKQVIDVASQRGAFRPNEMVTVGSIYNKLETFLGAVQEPQGDKNGS